MKAPQVFNDGEWLGWNGYTRLPHILIPNEQQPQGGSPNSPMHDREGKRGVTEGGAEKSPSVARSLSPGAGAGAGERSPSPAGELGQSPPRSPRFKKSASSPSAGGELLPPLDPKKRQQLELISRTEQHIDGISRVGRKGNKTRHETLQYMVTAEKTRFRRYQREDEELQVRVDQLAQMPMKRMSRASSSMDHAFKGRSKNKTGSRSHSSLSQSPSKVPSVAQCHDWNCYGGYVQSVRMDAPRQLSPSQKRSYQKKLSKAVLPGGEGSLANAARGMGSNANWS